jgi:hypothetical protein
MSSSTSSQKRCPAYVTGIVDPINANAARRRNFPMARRPPAPTWTIPFSLTSVAVSEGKIGKMFVRGSVTASAAFTFPSGSRTASTPPAMNMEANKGRATRREMLMPGLYPCHKILCEGIHRQSSEQGEVGGRKLHPEPDLRAAIRRWMNAT